jgi:hypothetical protein
MKAVCTICSREKDPEQTFLPAHQRYLGEHVALVRRYARENALPFFVLSGKFGLVHEDDMVPYYDYLLSEGDVPKLIGLVEAQLIGHGMQKLWFHHKLKQSWKPYATALIGACLRAQVQYVDMPLTDKPTVLDSMR